MGINFGIEGLSDIKPIRDIVYENLKKAILDGQLKSGDRIVEKDFAEKMNISRTPVREAIRKLETEGLVEYIPRKGVVVKSFSVDDIIEICDIRKSLECLAIKQIIKKITAVEIKKLTALIEAAEEANKKGDAETVIKATKEFNEMILNTSKRPMLISILNTLEEYLERFRRVTLSDEERRITAINEHKGIFQAILNKDVKQAENLVIKHIDMVEKALLKNFKNE